MNDIKLYENIKSLREQLGLSQDELAKKVGYTDRSTIAKIETGRVDLPRSKIIKFAEALQTSPVKLMGWKDETDKILKDNPDIIPLKKIKTIPILGDICAGTGIWCEENYLGTVQIDEYIKADYCLIVHGDSMKGAGIQDGDYAFLKRQSVLENREIGAVYFNEDNRVMLRRAFFGEKTATFYPENPDYEPVQSNDFIILGKLVGFYHEVK